MKEKIEKAYDENFIDASIYRSVSIIRKGPTSSSHVYASQAEQNQRNLFQSARELRIVPSSALTIAPPLTVISWHL